MREPYALPRMPVGRAMHVIDQQIVRAPVRTIFDIVKAVEHWPGYLAHYRYVRFKQRAYDGGGLVVMSAYRPVGPVGWPTWWESHMTVDQVAPLIRFRHVGGITTGMDVEWTFTPVDGDQATDVKVVHVWDGPEWPLIGVVAATQVIGPVFIHGIASRTLAGLARVAERDAANRRGP